MNCDFLAVGGHIRSVEVRESRESGDRSAVDQIPVVVDHVYVHSDAPHLK